MFERFEELLVLSKTLNFNIAASVLHMSQSSLTRHIAGLEASLGFRFFDRSPMKLTSEGQYFVTATSKLFDDYMDVVKKCRDMARESQNSICINMPKASNAYWDDIVYESVSELQLRHPEIPLPHFCQQGTITVEASVLSGIADVGIVFREPKELPEAFSCTRLMSFPLAVYFVKSSPLAMLDEVSFEDLADKYLICPTNAQLQATFEGAVDAFRRNGVEPKYRVRELGEFDRLSYILNDDEIVLGNNINRNSAHRNLLGRPIVGKCVDYPVYLLYNARSPKPATGLFVDICVGVAKHLDIRSFEKDSYGSLS